MNYPKQLIDQFTSIIDAEYIQYCKLHEIAANQADFITYLIDKGILNITTMKHFTILEEFKKLYPEMRYHKTNTLSIWLVNFICPSEVFGRLLKVNWMKSKKHNIIFTLLKVILAPYSNLLDNK